MIQSTNWLIKKQGKSVSYIIKINIKEYYFSISIFSFIIVIYDIISNFLLFRK